jgi:putative acetyltransferase
MTAYRIIEDDLSGPDVAALLEYHLAEMHRWSPAGKVHAMPIERLRAPDVTFYSAWDGSALAAVGALKHLGGERGELKSMRAAPAYRGRGAGRAILEHMIAEADRRGYRWLGLETGRPEPFQPAHRLYAGYGFAECPPFGDYLSDAFSLCMARELER